MAQIETKHREICKHVHDRIVNGTYGAGQRIPTEAELASTFETSRVTVARALRELEIQGLLLRRRGAGSFVRPPERVGYLFGLVSSTRQGIMARITDAMVEDAHARGLGVLSSVWAESDPDRLILQAEALCNEYTEKKVAGVFLCSPELPPEKADIASRLAQPFRSCHMPVVLLDRDICDAPCRSDFDVVGIDNFQAGYVLTEHLWNLGRRRIIFARHARVVSTVTLRIQGYQYALERAGASPGADWVRRGATSEVEFVRGVLSDLRPDGIVCVNDHEAAQLIRSLSVLGVRVPDDIAVVSVDDDQWSTYLPVSLTTLRQPCKELGKTAIKTMIERLADPGMAPREVCLTCDLIVRESCGAKKKLERAVV